jgi:hypothetical protein
MAGHAGAQHDWLRTRRHCDETRAQNGAVPATDLACRSIAAAGTVEDTRATSDRVAMVPIVHPRRPSAPRSGGRPVVPACDSLAPKPRGYSLTLWIKCHTSSNRPRGSSWRFRKADAQFIGPAPQGEIVIGSWRGHARAEALITDVLQPSQRSAGAQGFVEPMRRWWWEVPRHLAFVPTALHGHGPRSGDCCRDCPGWRAADCQAASSTSAGSIG